MAIGNNLRVKCNIEYCYQRCKTRPIFYVSKTIYYIIYFNNVVQSKKNTVSNVLLTSCRYVFIC